MNDDRQDRRIRKTRSELADINRGTFYLHYHDVFDLLQNLEEEMFLKYTALLDRHDAEEVKESPRKLLVDLLCFIQENADLIRILIGSNGDPSSRKRFWFPGGSPLPANPNRNTSTSIPISPRAQSV